MEKEILIVVDMQNDFINGVLGNEYNEKVVLPNVLDLIDKNNGGIIFTMDTHLNYKNGKNIENKLIPEHCVKDTHGWELHDLIKNKVDIDNRPGCYIAPKSTFGSLDWLIALVDLFDIDENTIIKFCGLCTDICVVNNALILRNAFPENRIIVYADACGGTTVERHNAALDVMRSNLIEIV